MNAQQLFGKRIKELRKKRNLTQEQLAELIGIFQKQIGNIETGTTFTTMGNLEKLAQVLGVEVSELFEYNHQKTRDALIEEIHKIVSDVSDEKLKIIYRVIRDIA